jgi:hypothetical protein
MRDAMARRIWILAFLAAALLGGCGREQAPGTAGSTAPLVASTVPALGAKAVAANSVISATFNQAMNDATIGAATFTVTGPGNTLLTGTFTFSGDTATFTPAAPLANDTLFTAAITTGATNTTGQALAANHMWTFTTGPPPKVTSTNPASAATNVPVNQKITATFDEPMTPASITATGTFTVAVAGGGAAVTGAVSYDAASDTAIFTPGSALAASTEFTATITVAAQDAVGNALAANYSWSFTTGLAASATGPTVLFTDPVSAATGVPLNQKIAATFSEAMDPATISAAGTFTVAVTAGAVPVPGSVAYDTASNTAVFTPTANLAATTQFTATISAAAKSLTGIALGAGAVPDPWNFTTGAAVNAVAPTITLTNPAEAAINVATNATVNATFSAAMNPTTINDVTFAVAVAGAGGASVPGTVVYNPASQVATFTPLAPLITGTEYMATISNLVTDLTGKALAAGIAPNPWTFTVGASLDLIGPNLESASTFGDFGGGAGMTNQGVFTVINGDIGTTAVSTAVTGFHDLGTGCTYIETGSNIGLVNGKIYTAAPPPTVGCPEEGTAATFAIATQAASDALAAFNKLSPAQTPGGTDPGAGQLGGLTLFPGIYKAALGSFMITGSDLTLDAQGNANAVWVFQTASTFLIGDPGTPRNVILINGAQAKNVYWQVGSAATINPAGGGIMVGTIIASSGVTFSTVGNAAITTLNGRALGLNASVTMVNTVINVPAP